MEQPFTSAPHHDILLLLVQITILLFSARALGELAQRYRQPSVVGEILAGILLGPSILSNLFPFLSEWLVPHTEIQGYLLEVISLLGVMFLLLITGLETDIALIRRHARTAIGVSFGGIMVTFSTGLILGMLLPDKLLVDADKRIVFALFVATSMSISAIPVIAKVLIDLNLMRRDIGQTIIAAGMSDDTIGWILLSIVAGLASGEVITASTIGVSILKVLAFMILSFTLGAWILRHLFVFVQRRIRIRDKTLSFIVICMFLWGAFSQGLQLEAFLGAFVLGIIFSRFADFPNDVSHTLESVALGIFAPIFFAVAGLKVNLANLLNLEMIVISIIVIAVATGGKIIGTYLGARLIGKRDHWTALSFGAGLNARGAMEIIIATIGLELGILTQAMFSIIVLMAIVTSLMAPTALRWVLKHIQIGDDEEQRLRQEALLKDNLIANVHRVLLPVRRRESPDGLPIQTIEAQILARLGRTSSLTVTLFNVAADGESAKSQSFLNALSKRFSSLEVSRKVVSGTRAGDLILDEARRGYDLMVLGATVRPDDSTVLFNPVIDYLLRLAPCPTIIVQGERVRENWSPKRILVPTKGSPTSKRAAEVAFALANAADEAVYILRVIEERETTYFPKTQGVEERENYIAHQVVEELQELGRAQEVQTIGEVRYAPDAETGILEAARDNKIDMIVLGTSVRAGSDRLYLGPRVERILHNCPCPIIVVNVG